MDGRAYKREDGRKDSEASGRMLPADAGGCFQLIAHLWRCGVDDALEGGAAPFRPLLVRKQEVHPRHQRLVQLVVQRPVSTGGIIRTRSARAYENVRHATRRMEAVHRGFPN